MKALQDLKIFLLTAQLGSLSACARQMNLTPAATSAAIKRLEAELAVMLFVRSTRRLRLTQEGELFRQHCQEALQILDDGIQTLSQGVELIRGRLQLSTPSDLGRNLLLSWLDEFEQHFVRIHRNALVAKEKIDRLEAVEGNLHILHLRGLSAGMSVSRRHLPSVRKLMRLL